MKKKFRDLKKPTTLGDLDDLVAQVTVAIVAASESHPTKDDLKQEIKRIEDKVDKLDNKVSDIHRRIIDQEIKNAPTRQEFTKGSFVNNFIGINEYDPLCRTEAFNRLLDAA